MWRRFIIVVGVLVGLLLALAGLAKSPRVAEALRSHLETLASHTTGQDVHIGALSVGLLPPAVALEDVTVRPSPADAPTLSLRHLRVVPYPWPSSGGAPVLGDVEIAGLTVDHTIDLTEAFAPADKEPMHWRLPVDIYNLVLTDGDITLRLANRFVRLEGLNLTTRTSRVHGRQISASIGQGELYLPGPLINDPVPFTVRIHGAVQGTFDHPRAIHVDDIQAALPGLRLAVTGDVTGGEHALEQDPTLALTGRAEADGKTVCDWLPACPAITGHGTAVLKAQGPAAHPELSALVQGKHLAIGMHTVGDAQVEARVDNRGLNVDALRLEHPDAGTLTGSGSIAWDTAHAVQFNARLHDAVLPQVLATCGLPGAWVRMLLNGDVEGTGTLTPANVVLLTDLDTQDFQVLDGPFSDTQADVLFNVPRGTVRGQARLDSHQITLDGLRILSGTSQVAVDGTLAYTLATGMALRVSSDTLDLHDLGPIVGIAYEGHGGLAATVEGPYNDPAIASTVQADALAIHGYPLGDTSATLIYKYPSLAIERFTSQHGEGTLGGAGTIMFNHARALVEGAVEAENLDLRDLLTTLNLATVAKHFDAAVNGRVLLSGPLAAPSGVASFKTPHLLADGVTLGAMDLEGSFGDPKALLAGTLTLHLDHGAFNCHAELHNDDTVALGAHADDVPLTLLTPFLGDVPLTGALYADLHLAGPGDKLDGDIKARVDNFVAYDVTLGETQLHALAKASDLDITGTVLHGALPVAGNLTLGHHLPFAAEMVGNQVPVHHLWNLGADVGLTVTGALKASGDFTAPASLTADAHFDNVAATWRNMHLQSQTPVHLRYANGALELDPTQLAGPHVGIAVRGSLPNRGAMDVRLQAQGDLAVATALNAQVLSASGPFAFNVAVGGTPAKPQINGEGDIKHGSMHLSQSEQLIDNINTQLVFTGRSVAVQNGSASLGGGTLRFAGEAQLAGASHHSDINVHASLAGVELRPYTDCTTTLTGDLQLVGPSDDLQLKGLLHVDALRYTARLELDRIIPKRDAAPLRVPSLQAGQVVHLGVKLQGSNNIIISSTVLEAELQADLTLTGTLEHPGLLGNITPLWARARYRDNLFKVTRASIDFIDEYRVFTEFQLQAKTTACNMQADVSIQGNSDSYTVTPYGQDEHGLVDSQDVLTCLQFGLRLRDFDGNQHNSAGISDALPGSLDALWTVSGLDDKVRKLLPIAVDELRLTSGWSSLSQRTTARVLVGKELTPQVALKYSRSLDEYNDQALSLEYKLNDRATMQGSWLSVRDVPVGDFGVDLRLHWELQ